MKCRANLATVLVCLILPLTLCQTIWECSGKESTLTAKECLPNSRLTQGCYSIEHPLQFRPCSLICNDVEFISPAEIACREHCAGYLSRNCQVTTIMNTTSTTPSKGKKAAEISNAPETGTLMPTQKVQILASLLAAATLVAVIAVAVTVVMLIKYRRHRVPYRSISTHHQGNC